MYTPVMTSLRSPGRSASKPCPSAAPSASRRQVMQVASATGWLAQLGLFPPKAGGAPARDSTATGPTNEVVRTINGIRHKRLGSSDIIVSEMGLGTQRWGSADFNAPDETMCHSFLDKAVLENGVNLVDTAEQYPIPSDMTRPEGNTEVIIGKWMAKDKSRREKLVIASKITGGNNVTPANIRRDCDGSLRRLGTDYLDVYLLHWPARYTPQANWGQSLQYHHEAERSPYYKNAATFEEIAEAMGGLIEAGKIRGWGLCNDNAYGLAGCCAAAKALGVPPPVSMQNDFSLIDRRAEENGVSEASSPVNENVGFMAYNALAGGVLTGKYMDVPAAPDDPDERRALRSVRRPRGRMDDLSWGNTLYRYRSAPALEAVSRYAELAKDYDLSLTELSLRWCRERAAVTTTLVGQTSMKQLDEDIQAFQAKSGLPDELMWEIDRVHMLNRLPIFSSTDVGSDWRGAGEIGERIP
eukprot:CAMPEP_0177794500 /NCGR_PEP_ID=MMETSP0491_2-20121128/25685_1 /TAXON_ID=63592 /ORGANISM="Tetraselmis chuii, Strain PLY429" /LENGTH=468 /DNA_ID=CAMNT_0019317173 /DNA_START=373 /DNA_END=1779 /DNA_ORIENTATION=-